jgi:hypothetical protein
MPRYLVLSKTTWLRLPSEAAERMQDVGSIIEFPGSPGESLYPLDAAAHEAMKTVLWHRSRGQRAKHDLAVRRFRAELPRPAREILDPAMVEFVTFLEQADQRGKNMQP